MKLFSTALTALAVAASGSAMAQQDRLSYSYLELNYINLDIDEVGEGGDFLDDLENGNGWGISGSLEIGESWFVFADYSDTESDTGFVNDQGLFFSSDTDIKRLNLGAGFHMPMNDNADFVLRAAYTDFDRDRFNFGATDDARVGDLRDDSSDGYFADASIRAQLLDALEGSLGVRYTDVEETDNIGLIGSLLWEFTPGWGIALGVEAGDEIRTWNVGMRFSF